MIDREEGGPDEGARPTTDRRSGFKLLLLFGVPLVLVMLAELFLF